MSHRCFTFVAALWFCAPSPTPAQSERSLDLAATRVAYQGYLASNAVTIAPAYATAGAKGSVLTSVIATFFESGSVSAQLGLEGAGRIARSKRAALDFRGSGGMSFYGGIPSVDLIVGPRVTGLWPSAAVWAGAEAGGLGGRSSEGGVIRGSLGAWWRRGTLTARASVQPTSIRAGNYSDVTLDGALRVPGGRVRFGVAAGHRLTTVDSMRGNFAAGEARLRLARAVELTVAGGRSLPDMLRRTPGARYASVGLRFSNGGGPGITAGTRRLDATGGAISLVTERTDGDSIVLVIRAPDAASVEITGDFLEWQPRAMLRDGAGAWRAAFLLTPGVYRYNVRVNGGEWIVPAGAGRVNDDFGGEVAVLVVRSGEHE